MNKTTSRKHGSYDPRPFAYPKEHPFDPHPFSSWKRSGTLANGKRFEATSCFACISPGWRSDGKWRHGHPNEAERRRYEGR